MKIRIMGSIVHPAEKPKQYFGMLDIYSNQPQLFIPFNFTVMDNTELCPHILFFDDRMSLFLDADGRAAPEDMSLGPNQLGMYQILITSICFGIFNMLSRESHGFNYTLLIPKKTRRRARKPLDNIVVPFTFVIIDLDEKQVQAILNLGVKLYDTGD